jgi:hypothetical protein
MLKTTIKNGDLIVVNIPGLTPGVEGIAYRTAPYYVDSISGTNTSFPSNYTTTFNPVGTSGTPYGYNSIIVTMPAASAGSSPAVIIPANQKIVLNFTNLTTPSAVQSVITGSAALYTISYLAVADKTPNLYMEKGTYVFPAIGAAANVGASVGTPTSSGTDSNGNPYVTSVASSVMIQYVKKQMEWAIKAQKDYEAAYTKLRASDTTENRDAYQAITAIRNRLIASHPDSWYDGSAWRYGEDGHIKKCVEPTALTGTDGNCQLIYRTDMSGNLLKTSDGNNVLLMRKCPWKCNNPGQSGSDACRIDADCVKVVRWGIYLPDGSQIENALLATTRSSYDDIASSSSSSTLSDDDIYKRGITRNFNGYGQYSGRDHDKERHSRGLFGGIRDAAGNLIRGIGNWIDPDDPTSNARSDKHNAYYYDDGSPAATAYLGMYNGQGYDTESPYTAGAKPTSYFYTTNYYYTDGESQMNDGKSNMPGKLSKVTPYDQVIRF